MIQPRALREPDAAAYVGLSVSTLRTERLAKRFPEPVRLTARRQVWFREELDHWLDEKRGIVARDANPWDDV